MKETTKQNKTIELSKYLGKQIEVCGKTQREIATDLGYKNPNIITMFKQAHTKMPLDKVALMAESLGVDPVNLLRMTVKEYYPGMWEVIEGIMGRAVSENEYKMIEIIRANKQNPDADPHISTPSQEKKLIDFASTLD